MIVCECGQAKVLGFHLGFHLAVSPSRSPAPPESEVARIIAIIRHLPSALLKLSRVEAALACALAGARRQDPNRSVYVCGGIGNKDDLLLAVTHQGVNCGRGMDGPVTCEANAWQADVADYLLNTHLIDGVKFGLNGRQLLLFWRARAPHRSLGQGRPVLVQDAAEFAGRAASVEYDLKL